MSLRISGNRLIQTLPGEETRPTTSKVREAIFNIWQGTIEGCQWLDLCTGSGAMGAEALCHGAARAVGIEQNPKASAIALANWKKIAQETQQIAILRGNVLQKLATLSGQQFDRIYFDPPYQAGLYGPVFTAIVQFDLLFPQGEIAAEHSPKTAIGDHAGLTVVREKKYGNTAVTFLKRSALAL